MSLSEMLSSLNLMTLVIAVVIVGLGFLYFLRKRSNRHPMEGRQERNVAADLDAGHAAEDRSPKV
ncbi:MAG: hypothetical protein V4696_03460 [Pseudomonadota bacterium]